MEQKNVTLDKLPDEIIVEILKTLDSNTIVAALETSRKFKKLIKNSLELEQQYVWGLEQRAYLMRNTLSVLDQKIAENDITQQQRVDLAARIGLIQKSLCTLDFEIMQCRKDIEFKIGSCASDF